MPFPAKATDAQIVAAYYRSGRSVWSAASLLGMCGQSVHQRLVSLGLRLRNPRWTDADSDKLRSEYLSYKNDGRLSELALLMGRTKHFICRKARALGLTLLVPQVRTARLRVQQSKISKAWMAGNPHPRGFLGGKHSEDIKLLIGDASKRFAASVTDERRFEITRKTIMTKRKNGSFDIPRKASWKAGWREIGGKRKFYRSRWEANYARWLEFKKSRGDIIDWTHESDTFWFDGIKRGCVSYLPDFKVTLKDGTQEFHEVKGWMDDRSKTKIKRMAKYHPNVKLLVIEKKKYAHISRWGEMTCADWES